MLTLIIIAPISNLLPCYAVLIVNHRIPFCSLLSNLISDRIDSIGNIHRLVQVSFTLNSQQHGREIFLDY